MIQARTSYLPHEIHWNRVFEPITEDGSISRTIVDFSRFNATRPLSSKNRQLIAENNSEELNEIVNSNISHRSLMKTSDGIDENFNYLIEREILL